MRDDGEHLRVLLRVVSLDHAGDRVGEAVTQVDARIAEADACKKAFFIVRGVALQLGLTAMRRRRYT